MLDLIARLRREVATSILFISHNLAVVARMCDRVGVLYAGRLIEEGRTADLFGAPRHPYTAELIRCLPRQGRSKSVAPLATIPGFLPAPAARRQAASSPGGASWPTPRAATGCLNPTILAGA